MALKRRIYAQTVITPEQIAAYIDSGGRVRTLNDPEEQQLRIQERHAWNQLKRSRNLPRKQKAKSKQITEKDDKEKYWDRPLHGLSEQELLEMMKCENPRKKQLAQSEFSVRFYDHIYEFLIYGAHVRTGRDGGIQNALDITALTMQEAIRDIGSFEGKSTLLTWVKKIAINNARDFYKVDRPRYDADNPNAVVYDESYTYYEIGNDDVWASHAVESEEERITQHEKIDDEIDFDKVTVPIASLRIALRNGLLRVLRKEKRQRLREQINPLPGDYRRIIYFSYFAGPSPLEVERRRHVTRISKNPLSGFEIAERMERSIGAVDVLRRRAVKKLRETVIVDPYFVDYRSAADRILATRFELIIRILYILTKLEKALRRKFLKKSPTVKEGEEIFVSQVSK